MKNLLKDSKAYYEDNDYYEIFSVAEDAEHKVTEYLNNISKKKLIYFLLANALIPPAIKSIEAIITPDTSTIV